VIPLGGKRQGRQHWLIQQQTGCNDNLGIAKNDRPMTLVEKADNFVKRTSRRVVAGPERSRSEPHGTQETLELFQPLNEIRRHTSGSAQKDIQHVLTSPGLTAMLTWRNGPQRDGGQVHGFVTPIYIPHRGEAHIRFNMDGGGHA
jgi:hypothetical protein